MTALPHPLYFAEDYFAFGECFEAVKNPIYSTIITLFAQKHAPITIWW
jgi:hypothetical protein